MSMTARGNGVSRSDREWAEQIARLDDVATAARHAQRPVGVTWYSRRDGGRPGWRARRQSGHLRELAGCLHTVQEVCAALDGRSAREEATARERGEEDEDDDDEDEEEDDDDEQSETEAAAAAAVGPFIPFQDARGRATKRLKLCARKSTRRCGACCTPPTSAPAPSAAARPSTPYAPRIVSADISRGREPRVRIECVDDTGAPHDGAAPPPFTYVAASVEGGVTPGDEGGDEDSGEGGGARDGEARGATAIAVAVYGARAAAGAAAGAAAPRLTNNPAFLAGCSCDADGATCGALDEFGATPCECVRRMGGTSACVRARARAISRPQSSRVRERAFVSPFALQGTYSRSARRACGSTSSRSTSATTRAAATRGSAGTASCSAA